MVVLAMVGLVVLVMVMMVVLVMLVLSPDTVSILHAGEELSVVEVVAVDGGGDAGEVLEAVGGGPVGALSVL